MIKPPADWTGGARICPDRTVQSTESGLFVSPSGIYIHLTMQIQEQKTKRSNRRPWQLAELFDLETQDIIKACHEIGVSAKENDLLEPKIRDNLYSILRERKAGHASLNISEKKIPGPETSLSRPPEEPELHYQDELPKVGTIIDIKNVEYLEASDIESIHEALTEHFKRSKDPIEPSGVRDQNLLESAMARPHTSFGKQVKYMTMPYIGAAYLHSIICNHPFHNGNKRTALVSLLSFLDLNKYILYTQLNESEIYKALISIANRTMRSEKGAYGDDDREIIGIAKWIHKSLRKSRAKDPILKWGQLQNILKYYDCEINPATKGNAWDIKRAGEKTQVSVRNDGSDVDRETLKRIRTHLKLLPVDGYPSFVFYKKEEKVPEFINKYGALLSKLAKT